MKSYDYVCAKCSKPFQSRKLGKKYCSHRCFTSRFDAVTLKCETCGNDFTVPYRFRGQKTCGLECAKTAISKTLTTRETKDCLACGKPFEVVQSYKDKGKYCSYDCFLSTRKTRQPDVTKTCEHCQDKFTVPFTRKDQRFCGYECSNAGEHNGMFGVTGKDHPMFGRLAWNNGLTSRTDERLRAAGEKISVIIADKMVSGSWSPPTTGFKGEHYAGVKNGGKVVYLRSSYESLYARMLDAYESVVSWEHEPMRITYVFEGSVHNYVPDFLVASRIGPQHLVEVKPAILTNTPQNMVKQEAAVAWCKQNGVVYLVVTEKDLSTSPLCA